MELVRTLFVLTVIGFRVGECLFDNEKFGEHYPTHITSVQHSSSISFGHVSFYQSFVSSYHAVEKKQKLLYAVQSKRSSIIPVYLLLCGDIHPCPGPSANRSGENSEYKCFEKKGLHFIHLNIRSLPPKLDELRIIARNTRAACICITETWLDETVLDSEIQIQNYSIRRKDRNRHGGGVCIYVRTDLAFNPLDQLSHDNLEATWIELLLPKTKPIVCGVVYRPPQQTDFYELLESVGLETSFFDETECVVLGDFNTYVSSNKRSNLVKSLSSFLDLFNMSQIIKDFTRVSTTSSTIDLIPVTDSEKISQHGVLDIGVSDHSLIYCTRKVTRSIFNKHNTVTIRSTKNYNKEELQLCLLNADWSSVMM